MNDIVQVFSTRGWTCVQPLHAWHAGCWHFERKMNPFFATHIDVRSREHDAGGGGDPSRSHEWRQSIVFTDALFSRAFTCDRDTTPAPGAPRRYTRITANLDEALSRFEESDSLLSLVCDTETLMLAARLGWHACRCWYTHTRRCAQNSGRCERWLMLFRKQCNGGVVGGERVLSQRCMGDDEYEVEDRRSSHRVRRSERVIGLVALNETTRKLLADDADESNGEHTCLESSSSHEKKETPPPPPPPVLVAGPCCRP